jgi:Na+-transporting methylmalonyl-CoA/oxaloacetate decarboxylase gamma subunit
MNLRDFYLSLEVLGLGMAGIFLVLSLIYVMIKGLLKFFPPKSE